MGHSIVFKNLRLSATLRVEMAYQIVLLCGKADGQQKIALKSRKERRSRRDIPRYNSLGRMDSLRAALCACAKYLALDSRRECASPQPTNQRPRPFALTPGSPTISPPFSVAKTAVSGHLLCFFPRFWPRFPNHSKIPFGVPLLG